MVANTLVRRNTYCKSRGRSFASLDKLIKAGKVPTHGPKKLIDPDEADRAIAANVDPVKRKGGLKGNETYNGMTMEAHRLRREAHTAEIKALEAEKLRGKLVDRSEVERDAKLVARIQRDAWMNWPARIGPTIAAEFGIDPALLTERLDREIRFQLIDIADQVEG